jgi:hypothetical protein
MSIILRVLALVLLVLGSLFAMLGVTGFMVLLGPREKGEALFILCFCLTFSGLFIASGTLLWFIPKKKKAHQGPPTPTGRGIADNPDWPAN